MRVANDLVVDVGDVAHVGDLQPERAQPARDDIERHQKACVTDMAQIVDRDAADIHADLPRIDGQKRLDAA
jgi:hypothetical protein